MSSCSKIKDIADFLSGFAWKASDFKPSGKMPIIRIQNLGDNPNATFVFWNNAYDQRYIVKKGDMLLSLSGSIKVDVWQDRDALLNQRIIKIVPKAGTDKKWLYWLLNSLLNKFARMGKWALVNNVSSKDIADHAISVPNIETQKNISGILEKADNLRQKRKEQLALLDDYLKSVFLDMFGDPEVNDKGWEIKEFDYFASIDTRMTTDFQKYSEYPHIGISNIEKDTGILSGYKLVKEESLISGKYIFSPEHIIYSKIRPNLNKVALPDFHGLSSADSYPILVKKEHANRIFFTFLLRSSFFIDFILKHSKRTNIPKANKEQIRAFRGIAPPIDLQNKFSQIYEQVGQTKQKMRASLDEMDNHFNALMQRYFG